MVEGSSAGTASTHGKGRRASQSATASAAPMSDSAPGWAARAVPPRRSPASTASAISTGSAKRAGARKPSKPGTRSRSAAYGLPSPSDRPQSRRFGTEGQCERGQSHRCVEQGRGPHRAVDLPPGRSPHGPDGEKDDGGAGIEGAVGRDLGPEQQRPAIDPHAHVGLQVGAVLADGVASVGESHVVLHAVVDVEHRPEQDRQQQPAGDNLQQRHERQPRPPNHQRVQHHQADRQHQEDAQVHVRQRLERPADDEPGERPAFAGVDEPVERRQRQCAPSAGEHLHTGDLARRQVRTAGEEHAGDNGGVVRPVSRRTRTNIPKPAKA